MTDLYKLIIEGQQFSGKTTIANNLARRYLPGNPFLFKLSGPTDATPGQSFKGYMDNMLLDYAQLFRHISANSIVVDKFHISEQVFGKLYRNYEHNPEIIEAVESTLHQMNFKIIYLNMDEKEIDGRNQLKKEEFNQVNYQGLPLDEHKKIRTLYDHYIQKTRLEIIDVDVTGKTVLDTINHIKKELKIN